MVKRNDFNSITQEIVMRLSSIGAEKIILFGSYAYGTPTEESDLDLCIVERTVTSKIREALRIDELLDGIGISRDILVTSSEEFAFYSKEYGSVFRDIAEKGVVLWNS